MRTQHPDWYDIFDGSPPVTTLSPDGDWLLLESVDLQARCDNLPALTLIATHMVGLMETEDCPRLDRQVHDLGFLVQVAAERHEDGEEALVVAMLDEGRRINKRTEER